MHARHIPAREASAHISRLTIVDNDPAKARSAAARISREIRLATFVGAVRRNTTLGDLVTAGRLDECRSADAVIEAVVEVADEKARVLKEVSSVHGAGVPLVTTTSSIPVDELAAAVPHPEALIGVHS